MTPCSALGSGVTLVLTSALAAGCLGADHDMRAWAEGVHALAFEVSVGQDVHRRAVAAATDLDSFRAEEEDHLDSGMFHLEQMSVLVAEMGSQCSHRRAGAGPEFSEVEEWIADALAEMQRHSDATDAAVDLDAIRDEERRHDEAMGSVLETLLARTEEMSSAAGNYRCAVGS